MTKKTKNITKTTWGIGAHGAHGLAGVRRLD